jgi:hypothetical protein
MDALIQAQHCRKANEGVVTGRLSPTQRSIRTFVHCRQLKAGYFNRKSLSRFGGVRSLNSTVENRTAAANSCVTHDVVNTALSAMTRGGE